MGSLQVSVGSWMAALTVCCVVAALSVSISDGTRDEASLSPRTELPTAKPRLVKRLTYVETELDQLDVIRITSPQSFQQLALRWDQMGMRRPRLSARAQVGSDWTAWQRVDVDWNEGAAFNASVSFGAPTTTVEVVGATGRVSHLVADLYADLARPESAGEHTRPRTPTTPVGIDTLAPGRWRARRARCTAGTGRQDIMRVVMTDTSSPVTPAVSVESRLRQLQHHHVRYRGHCTLAEHLVISEDGRIWRGNNAIGVDDIATIDGDHGTLRVAFLGDLDRFRPTGAAMRAAATVLGWVQDQFVVTLTVGDTVVARGADAPLPSKSKGGAGRFLVDALPAIVASATEPRVPAGRRRSFGLCHDGANVYCGHCNVPLDVEGDYLPRVVTSELGAAPRAAGAALAVSARSRLHYALGTVGVLADDQTGIMFDPTVQPSALAVSAVEMTRDQVLVNESGQVVEAMWVLGVAPSGQDCAVEGAEADPADSQRWVTYQSSPGASTPSEFAHPDNPANRGCLSQRGAVCLADKGWSYASILTLFFANVRSTRRNNPCVEREVLPDNIELTCPSDAGRFCGRAIGLDFNALYACSRGVFAAVDQCQFGCTTRGDNAEGQCSTEAEGSRCPGGDGKVCGVAVGGERDTLYSCVDGHVVPVERCEDVCNENRPAFDDACGFKTCPAGSELSCGYDVGLDPAQLYRCANGRFTPVARCEAGCGTTNSAAAPGCLEVPAECPADGDGLYCGRDVSRSGDTLYRCAAGVVNEEQRCANGCVSVEGDDDACRDAPPTPPEPPPKKTKQVDQSPCTRGDGLYCGEELGRDNGLYRCVRGKAILEQRCDGGCARSAGGDATCEIPRQPDTPEATCPMDKSLVCGGSVRRNRRVLYNCHAGVLSPAESCFSVCRTNATGNDTCGASNPVCEDGPGPFCGERIGQRPGSLYRCVRGRLIFLKRCKDGCSVNADAAHDSCE